MDFAGTKPWAILSIYNMVATHEVAGMGCNIALTDWAYDAAIGSHRGNKEDRKVAKRRNTPWRAPSRQIARRRVSNHAKKIRPQIRQFLFAKCQNLSKRVTVCRFISERCLKLAESRCNSSTQVRTTRKLNMTRQKFTTNDETIFHFSINGKETNSQTLD